ncbi:RHS repeat protein [Enterobacter ludwigii]
MMDKIHMTDNFTTHATNFSSGLSSAVDPRTGLYTLSQSLLSLAANNQLGPAVNLSLTYDPLSSDNAGFGTGFSLNLTSYNTATGMLRLSSGERYRVSEASGQPVVLQKKLNNFIFRKTDDAYEVVWKNGVKEVLPGPVSSVSLRHPVRIESPTGRQIALTWDYTGDLPHLTHIADEFRTLLSVEYYGTISTVVRTLPDSEESAQLTLLFANQNLVSMTRYATGSENMVWSLDYQTVGGLYPVSGMSYPTGLQESVVYQAEVMRFPAKSGLSALPAVTRFRRYPGASQPATETQWSWSDNNYLGFGGTADWDANNDTGYGIAGTYHYSSTETLVSDEMSLDTTRTYNRFHLLNEETIRRDGATTSRSVIYYADELKTFDEQLAQFLLPRETTETLTDAKGNARSWTTLTTFDDQGNPLVQTDADGTVTTLSWYPPEGDDDCPPEQEGFTRFMKQRHVRYPVLYGYDDVPDSTEIYTYGLLGESNCVVQTSLSVLSGDTQLQKQVTAYDDVTGSPEFGRVTGTTETLIPESGDGEFMSHILFTTDVTGDRLQQQVTFTGHDGVVAVTGRVSSALSGLLYEETDAQGVLTTYAYDGYGRITRRMLAAGTPYERSTVWAYHLNDNPVTVQTGPTGVRLTTHYDGAGREISQHVLDIDTSQQEYEVYRVNYNAVGEAISETTQDWMTDSSAGLLSSSLVADAGYSVWGDINTLRTSDGLLSTNDSDPVGLTQRQQVLADTAGRESPSGRSGVINNVFDETSLLLVRSERYDTADEERGVTHYLHDGRGLLRRSEDERGHVTTFTSDARGRELTRTLPDGSVVTRRYAPHLSGEEVVELSVTGPDAEGRSRTWIAGTQAFDGLGRLTESVSGGRTTRYVYSGASTVPASVILPSGETVQYTYIAELGNAVSSLTAGGVVQTFNYDPTTGALLQAEEGDIRNINAWTPSGLLQEETVSRASGIRQAQHAYTLGGIPVSYTDMAGQSTAYEYDIDGRLTGITDEALTVSLSYDALGRLAARTVTDTATSASLMLALEYDDFSREIIRTITDSNGTTLTLEQTWLENNLLARRMTQRDGTILKDEQYQYDGRNRLVNYMVSGSEPPLDAYGFELAGEQYSHDALNNLTSVITLLADGSSDTATYHYDNPADPMQLTGVTHTHEGYPQSISLEYDTEGRMTLDEAGRTLGYDVTGRLSSISGEGITGGAYGYDALDRLVSQVVNAGDIRELYYRGEELVNEVSATQQR